MLTISTLNYWNWRETAQFIRDLVAICQGLEYRILVRDNSEMSEVEMLQRDLRDIVAPISYFESPENLGFACGHNRNFRAVEHGSGDAFLVINNDVRILDRDVMTSMLQVSGPHRLAACVIQTSEHGDVWFSGGTINRVTGDTNVCRRSFIGPPRSTGFLTGCCLMIAASLFESLGGFDERFFMYAEDLDLCLRARAAGSDLIVVNHCIVHEVGSGEKGTYSDMYLYWNTRNRLIVLRQHRLGIAPIGLGYYLLRYGVARSVQLSVRSQSPVRQIRIVWRGLWDGYFHAHRSCTAHEKSAYKKWSTGIQRFQLVATNATDDGDRLTSTPRPQ
jgi:GT2 family glycosyltransferase